MAGLRLRPDHSNTSAAIRITRASRLARRLGASAWWLLALTLMVLVVVTVPWNMDEFIMYHALACRAPSQHLNAFWFAQSCSGHATRIGPWEYQRSYDYIGAMSSVLLWPFRLVWSSIWTPFVLGAGVLVGVAVGLTRALAVPIRYAPAVVMWFPLLYSVLHDQGPVRVTMLVLVWTPLLATRFLDATWTGRIGWGSVTVVAWMLAMEDKPYFGYLLPGVILFTLASLSARGRLPSGAAAWGALTGLLAASASAAIGLLVVMQVDGGSYFDYLRRTGAQTRTLYQGGPLSAWTTAVFMAVDWPYFAHRATFFRGGNPPGQDLHALVLARLPSGATQAEDLALVLTGLVVVGFVGLVAFCGVRAARSRDPRLRRTSLLLLLTAGALIVAPIAGGGWANHHFVFAQAALVGFVLHAAVSTGIGHRRLLAAVSILAILSLIAVWLTPKTPDSSPEIPRAVNAALDVADDRSILNCASWGCFYTYSLLAERGFPVVQAGNSVLTHRLEVDAAADGRTIIHACAGCDGSSVRALYPGSTVAPIDAGTSVWRVFTVTPPTRVRISAPPARSPAPG